MCLPTEATNCSAILVIGVMARRRPRKQAESGEAHSLPDSSLARMLSERDRSYGRERIDPSARLGYFPMLTTHE
jgi:hypothetical protein